MDQNDWTRWFDFRNKLGNTIDHTEYLMVMELHAKYFNHKYKLLCKCKGKAIQKYIDDINQFWEKSPKAKIR
jgi:hypothetical protein